MGKIQIMKKNERKTHLFCELNVGDIFLDEDEEVCIKITPTITDDNELISAICITNGFLCYYDDGEPVIPIRAVMTIEEE